MCSSDLSGSPTNSSEVRLKGKTVTTIKEGRGEREKVTVGLIDGDSVPKELGCPTTLELERDSLRGGDSLEEGDLSGGIADALREEDEERTSNGEPILLSLSL